MFDLLGFTSIAIVSLLTLFAGLLRPDISKILLIALIVRVLVLLIGHYFVALPDSTADAISFEATAWSLAQFGFLNVLDGYVGPDAKFISWLIAIPYSLFGRSILMAQSMSLFFGMGCVFLGWKLAKITWDKQTANKVGWVIALFPSLILYSVLVMRETYIVFFLIVALYGVVTWIKNNNYKSLVLAILGFLGATFFHGALMIGALTFLVIVGTISFIKLYKSLINNLINIKFLCFF
jgi:4-amino-4-deoxy-L-arabinose transferase-like glycosyltransferase